MATSAKRAPASSAGTEARLHAASVRAGAGAAIQATLSSVPLLRPFIPARMLRAAKAMQPDVVRRDLVRTIYERHGLKPARWELESVLAVADTQAALAPLTRRDGLRDLLEGWLPAGLVRPWLRYTPIEPMVVETARAVATTWAAGRYADAVCRVRLAGADWLPAPLGEALQLAPGKLRDFSAEALGMALPPLKLAAALGGQVLRASGRIAEAARGATREPPRTTAASNAKRPAKGRASASTSTSTSRSRSRSRSRSKDRNQRGD